MNPQPTWAELEPYYRNYGAHTMMHGATSDDQSTVERARREGAFRGVVIKPKMRILDVGCGGGYFLSIMQKLGAECYGVEPSENGAQTAIGRGLNVFHGQLEAFAASTHERFDVITANHVVEHVPDPVRMLKAMNELLAPGGYIWIAVPNASYSLARALRGRWHSTDVPLHLMQFTPKSLRLAAVHAGLQLKSQQMESLQIPVEESLNLYFRFRWSIPQRLTKKLGFTRPLARWYARRADANSDGEAIIDQFTA